MAQIPFSVSPDRPPYYGWLMLIGLAGSLWWWSRLARRDERLFLIWGGALVSAFVGGKLGYVLAEGWRDFGQPDVWHRLLTGKTILGALLGGYAGVELVKKLLGYPSTTGDWFAFIVPAGITLGRVGCWLQGCCLGQICGESHWWTLTDRFGIPRWPAVPLEIAFNVLAMLVFALLRQCHRMPGQHFHLYLMAYGVFRFGHEWFRDTPRVLGPVSGYALLAVAVFVLGSIRFGQRCKSMGSSAS